MTKFYMTLAVLGAVLPYLFFDQFFFEHGFSLVEFTKQLFATSPASGFTVDLLISSCVFWVWSYREAQRHELSRWWGYVLLNLLIGLSCALPLFLYFRQKRLEAGDDRRVESPAGLAVSSS